MIEVVRLRMIYVLKDFLQVHLNAAAFTRVLVFCVRQKGDSPDTASSFTLVSSELQRKDKFMRVLFSCNVRKVTSFKSFFSLLNSFTCSRCEQIYELLLDSPISLQGVCTLACCCSCCLLGWLMRSFVFPRSTVSTRQRTERCSSPTATCIKWTPWSSIKPWRASPFTT